MKLKKINCWYCKESISKSYKTLRRKRQETIKENWELNPIGIEPGEKTIPIMEADKTHNDCQNMDIWYLY